MKLRAELSQDSVVDVCNRRGAAGPLREVGPEFAAPLLKLLAVLDMDSDRDVRLAACRALPACYERVAQSSPRFS